LIADSYTATSQLVSLNSKYVYRPIDAVVGSAAPYEKTLSTNERTHPIYSIMKTSHFTVILYKEEDMYIAECVEVGTVDQGATIEEVIAGLKEATKLYLEEFPLTMNNEQ